MDPLVALGLASNLFACITFASGLIKGTIEISTSPNGCSADTSRLDSVYRQLGDFCEGLNSCIEGVIPPDKTEWDKEDFARTTAIAVQKLSADCKADCNELLRIVGKLKTKDGTHGKWVSFRAAVQIILEKRNIEELEERLSRSQLRLTMHISTLASLSSRAQMNRLEKLDYRSTELQSDHQAAIASILARLDKFESSLQQKGELFTTDDVEHMQKEFKLLSVSEGNIAKEHSILKSLTFDSRPIRHIQIAKAHEKTFEWALTANNSSGICDWLKQGNGIFWISGKPGSGKSTLMKFIADSSTTSQLVTSWARPNKVIIASHYFWIGGTSMQRSYQGLLRTLLYEIFRKMPSLIRQTCVERWASSYSEDAWTLEEVRKAFQTISENTPGLQFCFFIDGMDEYSGNHEDRLQLCHILKDIAKSKNIKLCLSSRPWNVFEEAFAGTPKLYVHDLTRNDIQTYVECRLCEHPRWATVSQEHSQGQWLISEITAKSNGVFLWVYIVTKLLKESLTNRDELFQLQKRLRSFPSELEPFFKTILDSVDSFYHSCMSTALQIALAAGEHQLVLLLFWFHEEEYKDQRYAIDIPVSRKSDDDILDIKANTSFRLDSRTRGLLEAHPYFGSVNFLHRTARDFLSTPEMRDFLAAKVDVQLKFSPALSILKALVAMIKTCSAPRKITRGGFGVYETETDDAEPQHALLHLLSDALNFAQVLENDATDSSCHYSLLDELDRCVPLLLSTNQCELTPSTLLDKMQSIFREQLVQHELFKYLYSKVQSEPNFLADIGPMPEKMRHSLDRLVWKKIPPETASGSSPKQNRKRRNEWSDGQPEGKQRR